MEALGSILLVIAVAGLWVAAVVFGRDPEPRDGGDWRSGASLRSRTPRLGD